MSSKNPKKLRLATLLAVPLLVFSAACGGSDGLRAQDDVASVPEAPATRPETSSEQSDQPERSEPSKKTEGDAVKAGKSAFYDAQLEYVRCMRTKAGVEDFPDPRLSGYLDWPAIEANRDPKGFGEDVKGGKNGVCATEMRAADNLAPKRDQQKDFESMLAHATCMRDNGVSRFINPVMSGGNAIPGGEPNAMKPVIRTDSPVYQRAREACESKLLDGLDGMQ